MASDKPKSLQGYIDWARTTLGSDFELATEKTRYDSNIQSALNAIQKSPFWVDLTTFLQQQNTEHIARNGTEMLMTLEPDLVTKSFSSAVDKSFRHNVLWNKKYPNPPTEGWATTDSWYSAFDDLVRSTLVCKFIDGPKALGDQLNAHATAHGLKATHESRGTENGYYAFHHYTEFPLNLADTAWNTFPANVRLELQLTTQLQDVLRDLTHPLYERSRLSTEPRDKNWKWDYETPKFQTSYLGHTLHLIEAVIVQVRDSTNAKGSVDTSIKVDPATTPETTDES